THDAKRSADVRAALHVLTECPERWADVVAEASHAGEAVPDGQSAGAAWQSVFGLGAAVEARGRAAREPAADPVLPCERGR
ncbi:hypothetical protein, partial [Streptomyces griseorubens]|uniref:hypothetical protein n=1 Tax=Streptomyces griseorubens TaxID=66897 RepID=UPI0035138F6F